MPSSKFLIEKKQFDLLYKISGAYHFHQSGFSEWFLLHNYQLIISNLDGANSILDIGCGDGRLSTLIQAEEYVGVDYSFHALDLAKTHGSKRTELVCSSMPVLPFKSLYFDAVISSLTLQYLPLDEWPVLLAEIRRVLKGSGLFIFSHINPRHSLFIQTLQGSRSENVPLIEIYDQKQIINLLREHKFKPIRTVGTNLPIRSDWIAHRFQAVAYKFAAILGQLMPTRAYHYVVVTKKGN